MLHLTHVGYDAGRPLCGAARNGRDSYEHPAYSNEGFNRQMAREDLCQSCRWVYEDRCAKCGGYLAEDAEECLCPGCSTEDLGR